ncbi:hypothetical protein ACLMAB_09460 [Brevibacillus laterosporus]
MINLDAHTIISDQEIVDTKATIDLHLLVKILSGYATMREETKQLLKKIKFWRLTMNSFVRNYKSYTNKSKCYRLS